MSTGTVERSTMARARGACACMGRVLTRVVRALVTTAVVAVPLGAQELRGTVVEADGRTPAAGVVLVLQSATGGDSILARGISGERGTFALKAPSAGAVQLRALRIGYEPVTTGPFALTLGGVQTTTLVLTGSRIQLATVHVDDAKRCQVRPAGAMRVAQLFVDARTALLASTARVYGSDQRSQFVNYTRMEDTRGRLTAPVDRTTLSNALTNPYTSAPIDSLTRHGYVVPLSDGAMYYAPDASVMLSDAFAAQHCLQLVEGAGDMAGFVGIGFRPVGRPRGLVEVAGTLWLDGATNELQYLEFTYENLPFHTSASVGGRVEYIKTGDGSWIISRWSLRKAIVATPRATAALGREIPPTVVGMHINGGEVQSVRVDGNVLYMNNAAMQAGASREDVLTTLVSTAGTIAGSTVADRSTPGCEDAPKGFEGRITGRVVAPEGSPVNGANVKAEWRGEYKTAPGQTFAWQEHTLSAASQSDGMFAMCGAPLRTKLTLTADFGTDGSRPTSIVLTEAAPTALVEVALTTTNGVKPKATADVSARDATSSNGRLSGGVANAKDAGRNASNSDRRTQLIVTDAGGRPMPHVSVSLNGGATRVTDDAGAVTILNHQSDTLSVLVRRLGFAPFQGKLARASNSDAFRLTLLPVSQTLAAVNVQGRANAPLELTGFYDRMLEVQNGAHTGEFFTPEDINARSAGKISNFLYASRYVKVTQYNPGSGVIKRARMMLQGRQNCYMNIFIDGVPIHGLVGDPFQKGGEEAIDDFVDFSSIAAIEVYPSVATAPMSIASKVMGGACGIVAIWTGGR